MDDPHIKAFDNVADRLDRLELLTTGIAGHLRYYEETKTSGDICGRLFGLDFPIRIRDSNPRSAASAFHSNIFLDARKIVDGVWNFSNFEDALTENDYRKYLSDVMYDVWASKRSEQWHVGFDNGWCMEFNRGHHPVGSFDSYVVGRKLKEFLSGDFESVLHYGDELVLTAKEYIPMIRHVQEAERLVRVFGLKLFDAEVGMVEPEDALMAPLWVFHAKMNQAVVDRDGFGQWISRSASDILNSLHPKMQSRCRARWQSPREDLIHDVKWGFWLEDLPSNA